MKLLVVNGNRTQAITDLAVDEARRSADGATQVTGVTATFGANVISTHADNTIAAHAVLDLLARHHRDHDAAILAISLDTGLAAARELLPIPVIGMTEAALLTASLLGERFGMITFGHQTTPLYRELVERQGMTRRLAGLRTIATPSLGAYLDAATQAAQVEEEARALAADPAVGSVIVCGAALSGMARRLQPGCPVPLIDGIACATRQAEALVRAGHRPRPQPGVAQRAMTGISPELAALYQRAP